MRKSINKTTVIIVLAIFLTLSVGYALFSDTITIEGTATAQGTFDIQAECMTSVPVEIQNLLGSQYSDYQDNGYNNESCIVSDDEVTYSVGLDYPGASKWYVVKLSNIGTITASVPWQSVGESMNKNTLETYNSETNALISTKEIKASQSIELFIKTANYMFPQKNDGNFALTEEEQLSFSDPTGEKFLLRTGTGIYLVGLAEWPKEGYSEDGVYYKTTQTITFPWQQYNE